MGLQAALLPFFDVLSKARSLHRVMYINNMTRTWRPASCPYTGLACRSHTDPAKAGYFVCRSSGCASERRSPVSSPQLWVPGALGFQGKSLLKVAGHVGALRLPFAACARVIRRTTTPPFFRHSPTTSASVMPKPALGTHAARSLPAVANCKDAVTALITLQTRALQPPSTCLAARR